MSKLYEIRIYEPAVHGGLFPRPERWRYTNAYQFMPDDGRGKPLSQVGADGTWWFTDGVTEIYDPGIDGMTRAEIVGEIDEGRAMEKDRFVPVWRTVPTP
jgi:hypothetical protein